jgi:hypothetical protein
MMGKKYPFALRVLFFSVVYVAIAVAADAGLQFYRGEQYRMPTMEEAQQYFLIGICISVFMMLLSRNRRRSVPGGKP